MRNGKIAKLPVSVRNELNPRMERGESGETILEWLNGLPVVRTMLTEQFEGAPISKQNLSEWRLGGFREWELREDMFAQAGEMRGINGKIEVAELIGNLLAILTVRYAGLMSLWNGGLDPIFDAKVRVLRGLLRDFALILRTTPVAGKAKTEAKKRSRAEDADSLALGEALGQFRALLEAEAGEMEKGVVDQPKPADQAKVAKQPTLAENIKATNCSSGTLSQATGTVALPGTGLCEDATADKVVALPVAGAKSVLSKAEAAALMESGPVKPSQGGSIQKIDFSVATGPGAQLYAQRISP